MSISSLHTCDACCSITLSIAPTSAVVSFSIGCPSSGMQFDPKIGVFSFDAPDIILALSYIDQYVVEGCFDHYIPGCFCLYPQMCELI